MGIFDSKEEVLSIQLTQHGKRQLAAGTLKPAFYAFCDDDILYDSDFAGYTENTNDALTRILDETPRTHPQYLFHGVETEFKNNIKPSHTSYLSLNVLGSSQFNNKYKPSWDLVFESGEILSASTTFTGSDLGVVVPQIEMKEIVHDVNFIRNLNEEISEQLEIQSFEQDVLDNNIEELSDGSIIEVVNEDIFISLDEINSVFKNDNFEIEMFLVENKTVSSSLGEQTKEILTPLKFNQRSFKKDQIYDDEEFFTSFTDEELTASDVEYYFNVQADHEIPNDVFCKYIPQDRRQGVYGKYRKCPDRTTVLVKDYLSDAPEEVDDCD